MTIFRVCASRRKQIVVDLGQRNLLHSGLAKCASRLLAGGRRVAVEASSEAGEEYANLEKLDPSRACSAKLAGAACTGLAGTSLDPSGMQRIAGFEAGLQRMRGSERHGGDARGNCLAARDLHPGRRRRAADRGRRFSAAMRASKSLNALLLRYVQAFMVQTAHTAISNARATLDRRLARWILMGHDRVAGDSLPLTHEFLALMLGVRRAGVTETVHALASRGMIDAGRGQIVVRDRKALEKCAGKSYGVPEAEYRRLIGTFPYDGGG
jgi:hypothetical protein